MNVVYENIIFIYISLIYNREYWWTKSEECIAAKTLERKK